MRLPPVLSRPCVPTDPHARAAFFYTVPIGIIQAITNQQVGLNVITELIIGYALPGRPIAMMMFKTWGYITMAQALQFTQDFKLAHYMKVPPRPMFFCQVVATVIAGTVQLGVQAWLFTNIEDMCASDQPDGFICPSTQVFGTASIIVSGPSLLVLVRDLGGLTRSLSWLIVGRHRARAPVLARTDLLVCFLACPPALCSSLIAFGSAARSCSSSSSARSRPSSSGSCTRSGASRSSSTLSASASPASLSRWFAADADCPPQLPDHLLRHGQPPARDADQLRALGHRRVYLQLRHPEASFRLVDQVQLCVAAWAPLLSIPDTDRPPARSFARVDVLSAGLDSGYAVGTLIIFFWCVRLATFVSIRPDPPSPFPFVSASLQYPLNGAIGKDTIQTWWGNTVYTNTADALGTPLRTLVTGKTFGPSTW